MVEYIDTDECVRACGVDRNSVGISSDSLLEPQFTAKLCAPACYQKSPNIVDLYLNLAAGQGKNFPPQFIFSMNFLDYICLISVMLSGQPSSYHGGAYLELCGCSWAPGPVSSEQAESLVGDAPAPAPM
ncbi:hypothetical protein REPUB_Repub02eG0272200 [Reevesia pubescens]